jgi:tRNA uridine 5-carbamoylmethylation protein Kti12
MNFNLGDTFTFYDKSLKCFHQIYIKSIDSSDYYIVCHGYSFLENNNVIVYGASYYTSLELEHSKEIKNYSILLIEKFPKTEFIAKDTRGIFDKIMIEGIAQNI